MQTNDGALLFQVRADQSQIQKDVEAIKKQFEQMTNKAVEEGKKQANVWQTLLKGATAYFTLQGAQSFISQMVAVRSQFQQLEISFGTMLKSKEKANALMSQMTELAAKTPFGLQEVSEGAKRLLAFQVPAEEVTETLRRMGDVASGLGVPMGQLIHVYGQVKAQGRLLTNDLYQFMNAGIPIIAELSKVVGKSETEIKEMVSAGKIGFTEIQAVIKNMTNEGGLFYNLMAEQSKSLGGQISNLRDNFDQMLNEIGKSSEGVVSGAIQGVSFLVENYQTVGKLIAGLIATYGTYRTAVLVNIALTKGWAIAAKEDAIAKGIQTLATKAATVATGALNAVMMANPYVLVATAVVGLATSYILLRDNTTAAEKATKDYNDKKQQTIESEKAHKQHVDELIETVNNQALADTERSEALNELIKTYPKIFEKYDIETLKLADILKLKKEIANEDSRRSEINKINGYRKAKKDLEEFNKNPQAYLKPLNNAINTGRGMGWLNMFGYQSVTEREQREYLESMLKNHQNDLKKGIKNTALSDWKKNLKNLPENELQKQLQYRQRLIADLQKQEKEGKKWASHGVKFGNEWYSFNKEELQAQSQALKGQIDKLHEQTYNYTDLSKKYAKAVKDAEKALSDITNNKAGYKTESDYKKAISDAKEKLEQAKKEYNDFTVKPSGSSKARSTKNTLPDFDTEKAQRDHNRQIQDDLFAREESHIKIMKDGAEKRLAIIQLEYDKQEEEIRRRSEDQLNAFIETEKQKAEAQGKWKKGQAFDTNTPAINAEKTRLAENEKVLLASNAEYQRIQQEQLFKELLDKYKTYEQERTEILKQFEEEREQLEKNNINGRYNEQIAQSKKAQKRAEYELRKKHKVDGDVVGKLFEDFSGKSIEELEAIQEQAEKTFSEIQKYADPEILSDYRERLEQLKYAINGLQTPFARLATAFKNISLGKTQEERKKAFGQAIDSMRDINEISTQVNDAIGAIANGANISGLKHLTESFKEVQDVFSSALNWGATGSSLAGPVGGVIGMGIGIATSYFNSVAKSEEENARRRAHYKEMQIQYEETLNKLQLERILNEKHSNNFATDKISRYVELLDNLKTKQNELANGAKKLQETYVLKETKPFFTNYLSAKMYKDEKEKEGYKAFIKGQWSGSSWTGGTSEVHHTVSLYKKLKDVIGELVDEQGKIDTKKLKSLNIDMREFNDVGGDLINDVKRLENAKNLLRRLQEVQGEIEKVRSEVNKYVKETFGVLGNDFAETIVNSVEKGESAIENFGKTVTKVMRNFIKDFLVTKEIKKMFDDLENELTDIRTFTKGDQETVTKTQQAIINFVNNKLKPVLEKGQEKAKTMYQALEQSGIKMFDEQNRQTVEKGFARMSQDSADELNGQFRLMTELEKQTVMGIEKMYQSMQTFSAQQLKHLAGIEVNTYKLHNIENVVSEMKSEVSSVKTILGNIETKGIKMR